MGSIVEDYNNKTSEVNKIIPIEDWVRLSVLADEGKVGIMQALVFAYKLGCMDSNT